MDGHGPAGILYNLVKSQLSESATLTDAETQVQAVAASVGIPEDVVADVMSRFRTELNSEPGTVSAPRLLVDWGELPRVGHQVRPEFSLLCPQYSSRPDVCVRVDPDLDHDPTDRLRRPQAETSGLWTFHVPFRMTTGGLDCRPGHYLIDVEVSFRDVPAELPRFFRCRLRLNVSDASAVDGGVLEIDGDGQSMINLQGHNLKQFSRVILKGGQDSVINLQDAIGGSQESATAADAVIDKPSTTFEYDLKLDSVKQARLPTVCTALSVRAYLDSAGLFFEDGRRTLLFTRPRLTFGRNRDNDVVLRFLPRSDEHDQHSRNISRTHFLFELTPEGIEIRDQSRSGIELNYSVVQDRAVVATRHGGDHTAIDLGVTGTVPLSFRLEMVTFTPERHADVDELEFWDELYCELIGGRLSRLARDGLDMGLDAVRFDRVENLAGEEAYVLLLREACIGGSPNRAAVILNESGPQTQARLLHMDRSFWLQPIADAAPVTVNGTPVAPNTLVSLTPGMQIQFGHEVAMFDRLAQLHLD